MSYWSKDLFQYLDILGYWRPWPRSWKEKRTATVGAMPRGDLIVALVKAGTSGDRSAVQRAAEAIIAEERAKQHNVFADRLFKAVRVNGNGAHSVRPASDATARSRDFIAEVNPQRQLGDLVLPDVVRKGVDQLVEEQQRADLLRAHGVEPRHRVLLVGPPGTGKTSLAEAIAEAISIPLFIVRYEAMIGSYLGETAARLKRVFDYARTTPCVLFFDEFDAIGKERGDIHETGEIKRVVTSLLMQFDDLPSYTIVTGATNHPELLDRASWRRFQLRLALPLPTQRALAKYIEGFARRFPEKMGVAPSAIAKKLGTISYAEAEQFCMDIQRRHILSMNEQSLKSLISEQLTIWNARAEARDFKMHEDRDAGSSASDPADA